QSDEMDPILVEAVPALSFGLLGVTLPEHGAVVIQNVMLPGDEENVGVQASENLVDHIELRRLRKVGYVAGVQDEFRRMRERLDSLHSGLKRSDHVGICRLVKTHVTIADLDEAQSCRFVQLPSRIHLGSESIGLQHAAFDDT